jgi:hypothetical protein
MLLLYSLFIHILSYTLKTEAENYSEWSAHFYQTTRCHSIEAVDCDFVKFVRSYKGSVAFSLHYERLIIKLEYCLESVVFCDRKYRKHIARLQRVKHVAQKRGPGFLLRPLAI